ncbi:MAG: protease modulator HflC [Phycisphaerae bacterium]|nr:protease modulator HflC [Phycisphaerae bacterium]
MKNVWVLTFIVIILMVLGLFLFTFQVRETEMKLVTFFNEPRRTVMEPGWYFRWPPPIHVIRRFDRRSYLYETVLEDTTTRGGEPITVTSYVVWRIDDPLKFLGSVKDNKGAEKVLSSLLRNTQNSVIGKYYFSDFVNSDPKLIKLEAIEAEMAEKVSAHASAEYGIEIRTAGIRRLGISEQVTQDVFERMKSDRLRITQKIIADGDAEASKIRKDAESKRKELLAIVEAQAKAIRGSGDAEAAGYYKMLEDNKELAMFLRDIEALRKILKEKTTIVLGAETEPMGLLKSAPDLGSGKSGGQK